MTSVEIDYVAALSTMGRNLRPNEIRKLTALLGRSDVISLAAGAPSAETFPIEELAEIAAQVIRERGRFALQYGATRGHSGLIELVVSAMQDRSVETSPDEIVITTGSQQGLDLVARLLLDPGEVVLVELPSYVGGLIALHNARARMIGVKQDESGIDIEDVEAKLAQARDEGLRVKCIYTIPNYQNPSGVSLTRVRRERLVDVARANDLLIIEDDPYYELCFPGEERLAPLAALDPSRVIYMSSFSKVLAPGLRLAWLRAPREITERIELAKEGADLSSSVLDQAIVVEALRSGLVSRRLPELRQFYATRCRAMLAALDRSAPAGTTWTRPRGGFFVWMELTAGLDASNLLASAIESGVAYVPGQAFFVDAGGKNTLRLAFSKESPERIEAGIETLCRVVQDWGAKASTGTGQ